MCRAVTDNTKVTVNRRPRTCFAHGRAAGLVVDRLTPLVCAALVMLTAAAVAEPVRVSRSRLVHRFDFEATDQSGQKIGQAHELPRHWYVIGREAGTSQRTFHRQPLHKRLIQKNDFPRFTEVGFDDGYAASGDFAFHLGLNSGNAGAFLEVGAVPAVPESDYLVTARVRTQALKYARGRLIAYFINDRGSRIEKSVTRTEPLDTGGTWTTVQARLQGKYSDAAWIGLELRLMQPRAIERHPLNEQQIVLKDVRGDVWFDDISIWQLPHIEIATQSPVNILRGEDRPRIRAEVRDMTGQALTADVTVYDHRMKKVAHQRRRVGAGAANKWRWQPKLPNFGWYLTELTVRERGAAEQAPIARSVGALLWLPRSADLPRRDRAHFGVVVEAMPAKRLPLLPKLIEQTKLANLVLSAWREDDRAATSSSRQQRYSDALKPVTLKSDRLSMSFTPVPGALAEKTSEEANYTLRVLSKEPEQWMPYVGSALHWHGQYVKRWQLGATGDDRPFFFPKLTETVERVSRRLNNLVPGPRVVLPWNIHQPPKAALPDSVMYAVDVPPAVNARHLDQYLKQWEKDGRTYRLNLRQSPADRIAHPQRVRQLALRMLHAWEADRPTMTLDKPWTRAFERRVAILPDPLLGVFATTAQRLAGRRVIGRLPIGEGMQAMIFDGPAGGMLAVWNQSAPPGEAQLNMHLGKQPVAIDVWGNRQALKPDNEGRHHLRITHTPIFITGIDPELALFRAGLGVTEPFIKSLQTPHHRQLRVTNPWDHTITGTLRFTGPEGWSIQPGQHSFSISAGETQTLPLTLSFPIAEVAGRKHLRADVDLTAERRYNIQTAAPMKLGLKNVKFDPTLAMQRQPDGTADAIVNCVITNQGESRMALHVFANLPGRPRKERLIAQLQPGQSVVRRFQFEEARELLQNAAVRTGLRETNGPAILNKQLQLNQVP